MPPAIISPSAQYRWKAWLGIVTLAVVAYYPIFQAPFMKDDPFLIVANPFLRLGPIVLFKHAFLSNLFNDPASIMYRPLFTLLLSLEYHAWGLHPFWYHLAPLLFHAGGAILVYEWVETLGFESPAGLIIAALFAVHPMIVGDLTVSAGGEVMGTFFSLASLFALIKKSATGLWVGLVLYAMALFSKESSIVVPFLAAFTWWYLRWTPRCYWRLAPLGLLTGLYFAVRFAALKQGVGVPASTLMYFSSAAFPRISLCYLRFFMWPWPLQSWPPILRLSHAWPLNLALLLGLGAWLWRRGPRWGLYVYAWFFVTLGSKIPAMMTRDIMCNTWIYASLPALLLVMGVGLAHGIRSGQPIIRRGSLGVFLGLVFMWTAIAHWNVTARDSDEKNYRWSLRFGSPTFAQYKLGVILLRTGRPGEALPLFESACSAAPENLDCENVLDLAYFQAGQKKRGLERLEGIARQHPDHQLTQNNLSEMRRHL